MMSNRIEEFSVPGANATLIFERTPTGRLVTLCSTTRSYLVEDGNGTRVFDGGFATVRDIVLPRRWIRHVSAGAESWVEEYVWDDAGRPTRVDGVEIRRDEKNRILACIGVGPEWRYGYAQDTLAVIDGPHGTRHITRGVNGRPVSMREGRRSRVLRYDAEGRRLDAEPKPSRWHTDEMGRLWVVTRADGSVESTWLWDGFACLGRIDGPPGDPLAAIFSLDLSCTPVRVITRHGARRIPRDAFGEGLLDHPGVPGLYCGAVHDGLVYLRARVLDPRSGAFDRPDPFHGLAGDPRRINGYQGKLLVETPAGGAYTVSQNEPVGRIDPTGEISIPLLLSDFTWSLQNNLAGWFGMDFTLNFWIDMLSFNAGGLFKKFFSFEALSSDRSGSFGVRRDGVFSTSRAFTFQHEVWNSAALFDANAAQVFDPGGPFRPTLYGTLLRGVPASGAPFLLSGNQDPVTGPNTAMGWTRHGGAAEPVAPGSIVPQFPSGGLHFDVASTTLTGKTRCVMTELTPGATVVTATVTPATATLNVPGASVPFSAGGFVLLTDGAAGVDIKKVLEVTSQGATTRVRLEDASVAVATSDVRLRGLNGPAAHDTLSAVGPPGRLNVGPSSVAYVLNDALLLKQGGTKVGAALVSTLEAQMQLDGAIPAGMTAPLTVRSAVAGATTPGSLAGDVLAVTTGPLPAKGDAIVLAGGGATLGAAVIDEPTPTTRKLDRPPAELAPLGANVTWQPLPGGITLGTAATAPATAVFTFNPSAVRTSPNSGFVVIEDSSTPLKRTGRGLAALNYDAIVVGNALPGNPANPYDLDRFTIQAPDFSGLTIGTQSGLALSPGVTLPGVALQINQLGTPALAAGAPGSAGATLTGAMAALAAASIGAHTPSQLVVLQRGSQLEPAMIAKIRVTIQLDRALTLNASGLEVVPLASSGFAYSAARRDTFVVTVEPTVGGKPVELPRFRVGETVQVSWTEAKRPRQFVVKDVQGTTLTLDGDRSIPDATAPLSEPAAVTNLTVQRLIPASPGNGSSRLGIAGAPAAGAATDTVTFQAWAPNAFTNGSLVGIVSGNATLPASIRNGSQAVAIDFFAAPAMGDGAVNITIPAVNTFYAPSFTQSGVDLAIPSSIPALPASSTNLMIVVPYVAAPVSANGSLSSGTVKVPEDPENWELDQREGLRDHELTHTLQAATWGPLFTTPFPLFAIEGLLEGVSDIELPEFSPYVPATVQTDGLSWFLSIPDMQGIDFSEGTAVQLSSAAFSPRTVALGHKGADGQFNFPGDLSIPSGPVQVRRQVKHSFGTGFRNVTFNIFHVLTVGGILNLVAGSVWGGLIFSIGKLIYFLKRRVFHSGDEFPATVQAGGLSLQMSSPEGRTAVQGFQSIIVKAPNDSATRDVEDINGDVVKLKSAVTFAGSVTVIPYKTSDIADGLDFYPATVPDAAKPASIRISQKNNRSLDLHVFDRVTVAAGVTSRRGNVTAVNPDGVVELEEAPPTTGDDRSLRIAKVDENDPMGSADSRALTEMGLGWMRWLFDPYGQFQYRLHPKPGSPGDWVARIARYLLSTHSWTLPGLGYLFIDDLFHQPNNGHLSDMEQGASENSGNLYSPIGRIRGGFVKQDNPYATYAAAVGDVARYWHGTNAGLPILIPAGQRDTPGVQVRRMIRVIANVQNGSGAPEPNQGAQSSDTTTSGRFLPDVLFTKNPGAPDGDAVTAPSPPGFNAADGGYLPNSAQLEFSTGIYVGFTRPGTHRVTIQDNQGSTSWAQQGRQAQQAKTQTLWFDIVTSDVNVQFAGSPVTQQDPPAVLEMIPKQTAPISVSLDANDIKRNYAVTVTKPDNVLTVPAGSGLAVVAVNNTSETETVEISRVYKFNGTSFDADVLNQHGMHLPADLHIPVRSFQVKVTTTLKMRVAADTTSAELTDPHPGDTSFVLVPAGIFSVLAKKTVTYSGTPPAGITDPNPVITNPAAPAALTTFLGTGQVFQVAFGQDDPPEEAATVVFEVKVGTATDNVALSVSANYTPFFRLAAAAFDVHRGASLVLTCTDGVSAGDVQITPSGGITASTAGNTVTLVVEASAPTGPRTVLVTDAGNPTHKARRTITVLA